MSRCLLVVAAHPDDEVLGCGGLLARTVREGGCATVLLLTEGCSAQYPDAPEMIARKQAEAQRAMEELGGSVTLELAGLPELELALLPPVRVHDPVRDAVRRLRPDWVLVHHCGDLNRDHGVAHEAARVACRPTAELAPALLSYETLSSTEWGSVPFQPTVFVALTPEDLERKKSALAAYESEVRPWPHPRSLEAVEHLAHHRGAQAGVPSAEAFQLIWQRA